MTTNKNPYEIRLDVLKLAKEMLELDHNTAREIWLTQHRETNFSEMSADNTRAITASAPKPPSVNDVVAKAEALYEFVSNSNVNRTESSVTRNSNANRSESSVTISNNKTK